MSEPCLRVLYRDDHLLALDKPSGIRMHHDEGRRPDRREPVLVEVVRQALGVDAVYPIHRLDRGTSGVVLFALSARDARWLGSAIEGGVLHKGYLALVRGVPPDLVTFVHALTHHEGGPPLLSITAFGRLASVDSEPRHASLVQAHPRTGRQHQIRRHLRRLNHPILGDGRHGRPDLNRAFRDRYGLARMALHATWASVLHPATGERLTLRAPLPPDLLGPLRAMGFTERDLELAGAPQNASPSAR